MPADTYRTVAPVETVDSTSHLAMLNQKFTPSHTFVVSGAKPLTDVQCQQLPAQPGCPLHPDAPHWLQLGMPADTPLAEYRCMVCSPPPSPVFVQRLVGRGEKPLKHAALPKGTQDHLERLSLAGPIVIANERPVCLSCGGRWSQEIDRPSGVTIRCWTCREPIQELQG
jgi:hypothetical protein